MFMEEGRYPKVIFNYLRFAGLQTDWMRRSRNLDYKYGVGANRNEATDYIKWEKEVKRIVKKNQEAIWRREGLKKKSLNLYMKKPNPAPENFYDGGQGSSLLFQARVGALRTAERMKQIFKEEESDCKLCNEGKPEDLDHILFKCRGLANNHWIQKLRQQDIPINVILGFESGEGWTIEETKIVLLHWKKTHDKLMSSTIETAYTKT